MAHTTDPQTAVQTALAVAVGAGLLLMLVGPPVLRKTIVLLATLAGVGAGLLWLSPLLRHEGLPHWAGGLVGGLAGAVAGILVYRLVVCTLFGAVVAGLATLGVAAATGLQVPAPSTAGVTDLVAEQVAQTLEAASRAVQTPAPAADEAAASPDGPTEAAAPHPAAGRNGDSEESDALDEATGQESPLKEWAFESWEAATPAQRRGVVIASATGFCVGVLFALVTPTWAAGVSTSALGAAIVLPAGLLLARSLHIPEPRWLPTTAGGWLAAWGLLSAAGLAVQAARGRREPPPPAPAPAAPKT